MTDTTTPQSTDETPIDAPVDAVDRAIAGELPATGPTWGTAAGRARKALFWPRDARFAMLLSALPMTERRTREENPRWKSSEARALARREGSHG